VGRFGPCHGRFGHIENLWAILDRAILIRGPLWCRPVAKVSYMWLKCHICWCRLPLNVAENATSESVIIERGM